MLSVPIKKLGKDHKPHRGYSYFIIGDRHTIPVTHVEKDNACQLYWYCVQLFDGTWLAFDVRTLPNFDMPNFEATPSWLGKRQYVAEYLNSRNMPDLSFFTNKK